MNFEEYSKRPKLDDNELLKKYNDHLENIESSIRREHEYIEQSLKDIEESKNEKEEISKLTPKDWYDQEEEKLDKKCLGRLEEKLTWNGSWVDVKDDYEQCVLLPSDIQPVFNSRFLQFPDLVRLVIKAQKEPWFRGSIHQIVTPGNPPCLCCVKYSRDCDMEYGAVVIMAKKAPEEESHSDESSVES